MGFTRSTKTTELLQRDEIDSNFHDPYILNGYRPPNKGVWRTLQYSLNSQCNESFNTWSHAIACVYFMARFYHAFKGHWQDPLYYPLMSLSIGILAVFSMSTMAHALNSLSRKTRNRCFFFDYAGISIYGLGSGQVMYFYCRKLGVSEDSTPLYLFLTASLATSVITNILMCSTRHRWCQSKVLYRTVSCLMPFLVNSLPYFYRLSYCGELADNCDVTHLRIYIKHVLFLLLTALSNVFKLPERRYPGRFDALGQSHHFVHVFIALACEDMFEFSFKEMGRRASVIPMNTITPDFYNSILFTSAGVLGNLLIAIFFNNDIDATKEGLKEH